MRLCSQFLSACLLALLLVVVGAVPGSPSGSMDVANVTHHPHHGDTEAGHGHPVDPTSEKALSAHRSNARLGAIIDLVPPWRLFGTLRLLPESNRTPGGPHLLRRRNSSYDQGVGLLFHDQRPLA